jgi:hypothetical protein
VSRIEAQKLARRKRQIAKREIERRKRRIAKRLAESSAADRGQPMTQSDNIHYEVSNKVGGTGFGGMAGVHAFVKRIGLDWRINERLRIFKKRCPYYESDHVLNVAYNTLCGAKSLQEIELRRNDEYYLDSLGAERIPDPTTTGDFCRRMGSHHIDVLQDAIDDVRLDVWNAQGKEFKKLATIDMDATIVETDGECKEGMDISYKNIWGYHPLLFTFAETGEVLRLTNRSGNAQSGHNAFKDADKVIALCKKANFERILLRGDTAFTQTDHLDRWDDEGIEFVFGIARHANLMAKIDEIAEDQWKPVPRDPSYDPTTPNRARPDKVKRQIIETRGYKNRRLKEEVYVEVPYKPYKCSKTYRLIIIRKKQDVTEQGVLFEDDVYFFYITNTAPVRYSGLQVIYESNKRCNQENVIAQLYSARALHAPVDGLVSNWAYMVMAALSWTLKAWIALSIPDEPLENTRKATKRATQKARKDATTKIKEEKKRLLRMEHRTFVEQFIRIPAMVVRTGRKLIVRLVSINPCSHIFNQFLTVALQ